MALEAEMPTPGVAHEVTPGVRCVLAPNAGPMTHWGTNSYVLGQRSVAVVDPGPAEPAHLAALLTAVNGASVHAVLVTHAHRDHSAGAFAFARAVRAPVLAFGAPDAGRSAVMSRYAASGGGDGGEGVDTAFSPDARLADGGTVDYGDGTVTALHTPGHFGGHLCFSLGDTVLTGDLVMGWATTLISPPDGDVRDFLASCARLNDRRDAMFLPGHGAPILDPAARLDWLVAHRRERESEVLSKLGEAAATAAEIAQAVYSGLAPALLPAAARNVLAHLLDLEDRGIVASDDQARSRARWRLV